MDQAFQARKLAVVTGAALGIGRAAATRFAEMGMRVVLFDLASDDFDETAHGLMGSVGDSNVLKVELSVTDADGHNALASDVAECFAGQGRRVRLHRALLQCQATPLDPRLSQPDGVRETGVVS